MNKNELVLNFQNILRKYDKTYNESQISLTIDRWEKEKHSLLSLMRKHENWDENALAIIMEHDDTRTTDIERYQNNLNRLIMYVGSHIKIPHNVNKILCAFYEFSYQFIDVDFKEHLKEYYSYDCKEGQKTSKVLNKIFTSIRANNLTDENKNEPENKNFQSYNKLFAKVADDLNPLIVKRKTIISINPLDFLLMSNGTGWSSCHNISDGCYMAGVLSYMCDNVSFLFYTINNDYNGNEFWGEEKIIRNVFAYDNGVLIQSRLYPNNSNEKKEIYRNIVQSVFANINKHCNFWSFKKGVENVREYCETHSESKHYPDYIYIDNFPNVSILKNFKLNDGKMIIGSYCECLKCGNVIHEESQLYCDDCEGNITCYECGYEIDISYAIEVNGNYYCEDCVEYCSHCESYTINETTHVENVGYVCEDCLTYFTECECCGRYIEDHDVIWIDGENMSVCEKCATDNFSMCEHCGSSYYNKDLNYHEETSYYYCDSCYEEITEK